MGLYAGKGRKGNRRRKEDEKCRGVKEEKKERKREGRWMGKEEGRGEKGRGVEGSKKWKNVTGIERNQ